MVRAVLTEQGEDARAAAMVTLALYRRTERCLAGTPRRARGRFSRLGRILSVEEPATSAVTRLVSIAEDYTRLLLERLIESSLGKESQIAQALLKRFPPRADESWEGMIEYLTGVFSLDVRGFRDYDALMGFIEARNAITHGLGRLTKKQMANESRTRGRLKPAGLAVVANEIHLSAENVERCSKCVVSYVEYLDGLR